jgi:hypothetical protein
VTFQHGAASGTTQNVLLSPVNDTLLEGQRDREVEAPEPGRLHRDQVARERHNLTTIMDDESATLAIAATSSATETGGAQSVGVVTLTITGTGTGDFALGAGSA